MSERKRASTLAIWIITAVTLAPVAYVLLLGPLLWLEGHKLLSPRSSEVLETIYLPLKLLCGRVPELEAALDWYVSCWW